MEHVYSFLERFHKKACVAQRIKKSMMCLSPDLKGQIFLGPRHPDKGKHESNEDLPFLEVPSHGSYLHSW
jgi:hypothetical protein